MLSLSINSPEDCNHHAHFYTVSRNCGKIAVRYLTVYRVLRDQHFHDLHYYGHVYFYFYFDCDINREHHLYYRLSNSLYFS